MPTIDLRLGDCLSILPTLPDASVDCVITDPPYPEISRPYGRLTEAEWWALVVEGVIPQVRRILKPTGSAVFILQPNSRKVGSMRGWLWEFMAWACREWNMVQDAWWWNTAAFPSGGTNCHGMLRASLKACVWLGASDCHRDQAAVLWEESERQKVLRATERAEVRMYPSGQQKDNRRMYAAAMAKGGVTPFNVFPTPNTRIDRGGHGAGTPDTLASFWLRYICPPGGTVLDPFVGSGTVALEALKLGRSAIGIERMPEYHAIARRRIDAAQEAA